MGVSGILPILHPWPLAYSEWIEQPVSRMAFQSPRLPVSDGTFPPFYHSADPRTVNIKLTSIDPWARQIRIVVKNLPAIVGRDPKSDVCLADQWVSRVHCELYELNGSLAVRDLGSKHGTFVNGLRVQETILLPGNKLSLGMTALKVDYKRRATKAGVVMNTQVDGVEAEEAEAVRKQCLDVAGGPW